MVSLCLRMLPSYLAAASFVPLALCQPESKFEVCKARLDRILNGTEVFHGISNETIEQYIYRGPVGGMKPEYAQRFRNTFIAITTDGCKAICEDPIDWYWTSDPLLTLGIISNWILPIIALLAALPFDTQSQSNRNKRNRFAAARNTVCAVYNWLGSPQTALTATFFNIHQMRKCLDATRSFGHKALSTDAYYVLCCIGQFGLPSEEASLNCFLDGLVYGLFKPAYESRYVIEAEHTRQAKRWTRDLLRAMAHQMRRSRRLGIWSTLASILLFFVAYAASVVLAFGDLGERTTTHSLAFGILITWLPLLLFFSILDRNPNSADRTRKFIHRWLWNIRAVQVWEQDRDRDLALNSDNAAQQVPYWWSERREQLATAAQQEEDREPGHRCTPRDSCELSAFVGQGRHIGYFGLALSVAKAREDAQTRTYDTDGDRDGICSRQLTDIVQTTKRYLRAKPPCAWRWLALAAFAMVWWELGTALLISYNIPTVGIGCRSGSYIIYGILSTVPWFAHIYRCLGPQASTARGWFGRLGQLLGKLLDSLSAVCLVLAVPFLVFITFSAVSSTRSRH